MSSFQDFSVFTIAFRQKPKRVTCSQRYRTKTERAPFLRRLHVTPLSFCLRVIVKETHRKPKIDEI